MLRHKMTIHGHVREVMRLAYSSNVIATVVHLEKIKIRIKYGFGNIFEFFVCHILAMKSISI
jgi:hypothetical protein